MVTSLIYRNLSCYATGRTLHPTSKDLKIDITDGECRDQEHGGRSHDQFSVETRSYRFPLSDEDIQIFEFCKSKVADGGQAEVEIIVACNETGVNFKKSILSGIGLRRHD